MHIKLAISATEDADQSCYLTHSQYTDTRPTSSVFATQSLASNGVSTRVPGLFFYPYEKYMDQCDQLCSSVWPVSRPLSGQLCSSVWPVSRPLSGQLCSSVWPVSRPLSGQLCSSVWPVSRPLSGQLCSSVWPASNLTQIGLIIYRHY